MTMAKPPSLEIMDALQPVLQDRALMALIKNRYVPFIFIVKRACGKLTAENSLRVMQALQSSSHGNTVGIQDLGVHFSRVADILHVGGGRLAERGGHKVIEDLASLDIREALSTTSRLASRVFGVNHYDPLNKKYKLYESVLRECDLCTSLPEARKRAGVGEQEWKHLKAVMGRFGLLRDIVYAKSLLLDGSLVREIEQRFLGQRVEDVVPRLLREQMQGQST